MKNLRKLNLRNNKLVGLIPSSQIHLINLALLSLSLNQISGSIPLEIGNLKNLTCLSVDNNKLVGLIPSSLGHLTNLTSLSVSSNQINGSLP